MLKRIASTLSLILFLSGSYLHAQGIEGKIVDINGKPVSYASIFIKELSRGTTSNSLGLFSLPLPSGEYNIFFRSLGYTEVIKKITVSEKMVSLDVEMPPQTYMIPEVRISATGEDPAYRVMRKAIGLANYHLNQVSTYDAEIYIKGTAYFHRLPRAIAKRIEVGDIKVEENRAYMLESVNEVTYRAPDKYDMRIIASQNTIPGYIESVNPMDYVNASLYQPQIESFVSPLARNAFFYYNFSFEGSFLQGNHMVDKIKVTPKRKSQQLCSGFLYIVEDLWCLHSSDLVVNTIAGTVNLQQQYANVIMDAWLPVSHKLDMVVEIAGVRADATYVSSLKYTKTTLNPNLPKSYFEPVNKANEEDEKEVVTEEQEKIREILEKEELNDREMARLTKLMEKEAEASLPDNNKLEVESTKFSIAPNAVTNDSSYWNKVRPVPLTVEEKNTIVTRDSIHGFGNTDYAARRDSLRNVRKPSVKARDFIIGKTFQSKDRLTKIRYGGLIDFSMLSFNTVDGWKYGQDLGYDYRPHNNIVYRWNLQAGYSFARRAPDLNWTSSILYAAKIRGKIALNMDYKSVDFNSETGIPTFTNSAYSLFYRENFSKRFESLSATLEHRMDLATGLVFYATMNYQERRELNNHSDFSFFYQNKDYTPNYPAGFVPDRAIFDDSRLLAAQVRLEYTKDYYYRLKNGRKQYFKSDYPTLYAVYRHALPSPGFSEADYSLLYGGLHHEKEVGLLSSLSYKIEAGTYLHTTSMHFSDYRHFKASPLLFDMIGFQESFLLLDHYRASTNEYFIQAHGRLTSSYMLLKLLPWFSERLWNESVSVSYLHTPNVQNHFQAGYSLNEIGFLFDVGVFVAFEDWIYHGTALRFYLRF
ncbi:MAG: DUF5686 and carboxypeptidase regulatory-like domain-containing protein [Bacteroidales bacterium]